MTTVRSTLERISIAAIAMVACWLCVPGVPPPSAAFGQTVLAATSTTAASDTPATIAIDRDSVAEWRATAERLRQDVKAILSSRSGQASSTQLQKLERELADLERRIAQVESNSPAIRRDDKVTAARLEADAPEVNPAPKLVADHPFAPAVDRAKSALKKIEAIKDYTAVMVKRERVAGELLEYEYVYMKVRHDPFSVYLKFLGPDQLRGREVIYVASKNNGNLLAHEPKKPKSVIGFLANQLGTASLAPNSVLAKQGNRYPITEIGILNLTKRLIEVGEEDMQSSAAEAGAKYFPKAKVEDRDCEAFVFIHPEKRKNFRFHRAEVFIDKELQMPIRYASYDWPSIEGEEPVLLETYTYTRLKMNVGLQDADFEITNPKYEFPK